MPDPEMPPDYRAAEWCSLAETAREEPRGAFQVSADLVIFADDQCRRLATELEAAKGELIRLREEVADLAPYAGWIPPDERFPTEEPAR